MQTVTPPPTGPIKYTGHMCARNRATCDTTCVLCVYTPPQTPAEAAVLYGDARVVPRPAQFEILCGCKPRLLYPQEDK